MRDSTKLLIDHYELQRLRYDFMGYEFNKLRDLSFHYLVIPRCEAPNMGLDRGYFYWNGVILTRDVAHTYLHIIEEYDYELFLEITSEMLDEKIKGYIDINNISRINDMLNYFEDKNIDELRNGKPLIREKYMKRVLKK